MEVEKPGGALKPPAEIAELLTGVLRGAKLEPVAKMRTTRRAVKVAGGDSRELAEVVLDSVKVLKDGRTTGAFEELEIEAIEASPEEMAKLVKAASRAGASATGGTPKLMRVLGAPAEGDPLGEGEDAIVQSALRLQCVRALQHDPGCRLGDDPEDLHQLRVALRRTREILRTIEPMTDPRWAKAMQRELKWVSKALNASRDLDVIIEYLEGIRSSFVPEHETQFAGMVQSLLTRREAARKTALDMMRSQRYLEFLDVLEAAGKKPFPKAGAHASLKSLAAAEFQELSAAVARLPHYRDGEEIHRIRILGKRTRYAAELASPVAGKAVAAFIDEAKMFQDLLGEANDAEVLAEQARRFTRNSADPSSWYFCGRLVERQEMRKQAALEKFPKAWRRLSRRGNKLWL